MRALYFLFRLIAATGVFAVVTMFFLEKMKEVEDARQDILPSRPDPIQALDTPFTPTKKTNGIAHDANEIVATTLEVEKEEAANKKENVPTELDKNTKKPTIFTGPKGGQYYYKNGRKVYLKRK